MTYIQYGKKKSFRFPILKIYFISYLKEPNTSMKKVSYIETLKVQICY